MITLPWPDAALSPNFHGHWRIRHTAFARAKAAATIATWHARPSIVIPDDLIFLRITAHPTCKRRRDDDNFIGRCKAYRDGIAKGLGIDDNRFTTLPLVIGETRKPGQVTFELLGKEQL